ncbi:6-phosphogluconolactonase [Geomonas sp. Red32]|uniref:6-phosphogluconolactonase n=1 Tax=Geomonas sp. Red32 TaxID=2912856 RepID=UPI00202CF644|nr:6-phosphogluconolactonase [Geomonas sp. Red32]MCM0084149.1 6-phosphogluconolactonase [Geomonas sp. Red32]
MLTVYRDKEALSRAAAAIFGEAARLAARRKGRFNVLLSGGETPLRCYRLLGEEPWRGSVPWEAVQIFWGDERYVPYADPRSNFGTFQRTVQDYWPVGDRQLHPVPFRDSAEASALAYEEELRGEFGGARPAFDLVFLGLGADGHTASLFPGSPAVEESSRLVTSLFLPEQELFRVTVTLPLLNEAVLAVFLVSGGDKAAILHRVLAPGDGVPPLPASRVHPGKGAVRWLVDRDAARQLSSPPTAAGTPGGTGSREGNQRS